MTSLKLSLITSTILLGLNSFAWAESQAPIQDTTATADTTNTTEKIEQIQVNGSRRAYYTEITDNAEKLLEVPGAFGDPLGAITALPGVITPANGGAPAVRGSSPSDNLYLIDSMPAGFIFHEFNSSIFNENIIQDFQLYTAGFGAEYGNATGAVFDIRLRDPKNKPITTTINASLLRAGVFVEGAVTENSAFYLSARRSLIQYFIPKDDEPDEDGIVLKTPPTDSDYQLKYVWDVNEHHALSVNLSGASDFIDLSLTEQSDYAEANPDFAGDAKMDNGFDSQSIQWRYLGERGNQATFIAGQYMSEEKITWGDDYYETTKLTNQFLKTDIAWRVNDNHLIKLGAQQNNYHYKYDVRTVLFICSDFDVSCQDGRRDVINEKNQLATTEQQAYLIDLWDITSRLQIETGLQWQYNDYTDETFVNPRMAMSLILTDSLTLISSAGQYNQLPELATVLPVVGNPQLKSPTAEHYTFGFKGNIGYHWNWSIESYHKKLAELPLGLSEDEPDADQLFSNDVEGEANGIDLFLNRDLANNWYGWISISYSESKRTNLRTNETRTYQLDTPLVVNIVGQYKLSPLWQLGFRFAAKSGEADTEIIGVKQNPDFPDKYLPVYGEAYQDRLPIYARLDLRAEREINWFGHKGAFYVDIINALNRKNISSRGLDYDKVNATGNLHVKNEADLGIFPSVGVSFTF